MLKELMSARVQLILMTKSRTYVLMSVFLVVLAVAVGIGLAEVVSSALMPVEASGQRIDGPTCKFLKNTANEEELWASKGCPLSKNEELDTSRVMGQAQGVWVYKVVPKFGTADVIGSGITGNLTAGTAGYGVVPSTVYTMSIVAPKVICYDWSPQPDITLQEIALAMPTIGWMSEGYKMNMQSLYPTSSGLQVLPMSYCFTDRAWAAAVDARVMRHFSKRAANP